MEAGEGFGRDERHEGGGWLVEGGEVVAELVFNEVDVVADGQAVCGGAEVSGDVDGGGVAVFRS